LFHLLFRLFARDIQKEVSERAQLLQGWAGHIDPRFEVLLVDEEQERVRRIIAARVSNQLAQPESATFSDETVYHRPDGGMVVCGQVQSVNPMGQPVTKVYVLGLSADWSFEGCEFPPRDPRRRA
jgi:hypothetical protein